VAACCEAGRTGGLACMVGWHGRFDPIFKKRERRKKKANLRGGQRGDRSSSANAWAGDLRATIILSPNGGAETGSRNDYFIYGLGCSHTGLSSQELRAARPLRSMVLRTAWFSVERLRPGPAYFYVLEPFRGAAGWIYRYVC